MHIMLASKIYRVLMVSDPYHRSFPVGLLIIQTIARLQATLLQLAVTNMDQIIQ